ncbi:MAG: FAD/NAD(P)-binding protein [Actinomycetota bacterium]
MTAPQADPMRPRPYRVARARREVRDVMTLAIEPLDGNGTQFAAGQFNMLYAFGIGEIPVSISGDPTRAGPLLHTIQGVGAVSRALCAAKPGDVIGVRGPFGTTWDTDRAAGADVLVIAGGIGLAPLRPVIYQLLARRERYGRISVLVGSRSPKTLLFEHDLQAWRSRLDLDLEVTVDHADTAWRGNVGVVTGLLARAPFDPLNTVAFVCGPEVMIRATASELVDRDISPESIRVSLERNMKCAIGHCGHCQLGGVFVCADGPVFSYDAVEHLMSVRSL